MLRASRRVTSLNRSKSRFRNIARICWGLGSPVAFASMSHPSVVIHAGARSPITISCGCNSKAVRTRSFSGTFVAMTRPFGAASVRLRASPDLFGLIEATSKVSLSAGPGADGACAAPEPVNRTIAVARCSIRMLQEPGSPGFVSVPGWTVRAVDDQHIDLTALCLELETKLLLQ